MSNFIRYTTLRNSNYYSIMPAVKRQSGTSCSGHAFYNAISPFIDYRTNGITPMSIYRYFVHYQSYYKYGENNSGLSSMASRVKSLSMKEFQNDDGSNPVTESSEFIQTPVQELYEPLINMTLMTYVLNNQPYIDDHGNTIKVEAFFWVENLLPFNNSFYLFPLIASNFADIDNAYLLAGEKKSEQEATVNKEYLLNIDAKRIPTIINLNEAYAKKTDNGKYVYSGKLMGHFVAFAGYNKSNDCFYIADSYNINKDDRRGYICVPGHNLLRKIAGLYHILALNINGELIKLVDYNTDLKMHTLDIMQETQKPHNYGFPESIE